MNSRPHTTSRLAWIEWVRAFGACAIVLLHVLGSTRNAFDLDQTRVLVYNVLSITLSRWAVPGFFMVSGLLLLDPQKSLDLRRIARYALRMVGVLASFGLLFALMEEMLIARDEGMALGLSAFATIVGRSVVDVLTGHTWDHLWYVYALLGVYIVLPVLRSVQARWGKRALYVLAALLFVGVLAVPTVLAVSVPNALVGIACFCVGGCLRRIRLSLAVVVAGVGSLAVMLGVSLAGLMHTGDDRNFIFLQGSCFACLYALFVLCLVREVVGDTARVDAQAAVARLAQDSFGIYVIHPLFVHIVLMVCDPLALPPVLFEAGFFAVALAASVVSTRAVRHVPVVGSLL